MIARLDGDEDRQVEVELGRIEQRDAPADVARLLQALDPPPTGVLRKPHLFGEIGQGRGGVGLQRLQDAFVEFVE